MTEKTLNKLKGLIASFEAEGDENKPSDNAAEETPPAKETPETDEPKAEESKDEPKEEPKEEEPKEEEDKPEEEEEDKPEEEPETKEVNPIEEAEVTGEPAGNDAEKTESEDDVMTVQPIGNEPKPLIFLAGTCSGSDWRDPFVERLKDAPFNPYIKEVEWTPQAAQNEVAMRNAASKIVFGITPKQSGPLTIFELGMSIMSSPDRTVVMILDEDDGDKWEDHAKASLEVIKASCKAQGVKLFDNPDQCIAFLNGEGEDFDEAIKPEESAPAPQESGDSGEGAGEGDGGFTNEPGDDLSGADVTDAADENAAAGDDASDDENGDDDGSFPEDF